MCKIICLLNTTEISHILIDIFGKRIEKRGECLKIRPSSRLNPLIFDTKPSCGQQNMSTQF